jgi:hypothetical protein
MRPIKKDSYYRSRNSVYRKWRLICVGCQATILDYQKDGRGQLKRVYLNRILAPESLACLQDTHFVATDLQALKCASCGELIGLPMLHWEGRIAFRLLPGRWGKQVLKDNKEKSRR